MRRLLAWTFTSLVLGLGWRASQTPGLTTLQRHAAQAQQAGNLAAAEQFLLTAVDRYSHRLTNAQLLEIAKLAQELEHWPESQAVCRRISNQVPEAAAARFLEGVAWIELGDAVRAEWAWKRALHFKPQFQLAEIRLIVLYSFQLRRAEWLELLWQRVDNGAPSANELTQLLLAAEVIWETTDLLATITRYAQTNPQDKHSRRAWAIYVLQLNRAEEALAELALLRQQFPDDPDIALEYGHSLIFLGRVAEAEQALLELPANLEDQWRYWLFVGKIHLAANRLTLALQALLRAYQLAPFNREVHTLLAQVYRLSSDQGDAQAAFHALRAFQLERIQTLLHQLKTAKWNEALVLEMIPLLHETGLREEGLAWARLLQRLGCQEPQLLELMQQLQSAPLTSRRRLPPIVLP